MSDNTIDMVKEALGGSVITAAGADYDGVCSVYHAMHDRRPSAVVRCTAPAKGR